MPFANERGLRCGSRYLWQMERTKPGPNVNPVLTLDEALVLFEWLSAHEEADSLGAIAGSPAALVALQALLCSLESILVEPFQSEYLDLLEAARRRLTKT